MDSFIKKNQTKTTALNDNHQKQRNHNHNPKFIKIPTFHHQIQRTQQKPHQCISFTIKNKRKTKIKHTIHQKNPKPEQNSQAQKKNHRNAHLKTEINQSINQRPIRTSPMGD